MNDFKTFIDSKDIKKINDFYKEGFYAADTMLVMEAPIGDCEPDKEVTEYAAADLKEYLKANGKGFGVADPISQLEEQLSYEAAKILVLRDSKGKIASSVTIWNIDDDVVATENIFTVPGHREKGYAGRVLLTALAEGKQRGKTKARLTVYAGDIAAIKMYYKFGFTITRVLQEFRHE